MNLVPRFQLSFSLLSILPMLGCDAGNHPDDLSLERSTQALQNVSEPTIQGTTPVTTGVAGLYDGVRTWTIPNTPNGLVPNQSWFAIAPAPDGSIYVGASDHTTNSALYRLGENSDLLRYVGDARAASEAVGNWFSGETAEKFHLRPLWYQNRLYIATADYSNVDSGYLQQRGAHLYSYDETTSEFKDLSATAPHGVWGEHTSIFSSALDQTRGIIYGLGAPDAHLYQYAIATGQSVDLGKHTLLTRELYSAGRFMWVDSGGRVYFAVGAVGTVTPGDPAAPRHILYWDPITGWGGVPSWTIIPRIGQWSRDKRFCFMMSDPGLLFRFDNLTRRFQLLNIGRLRPEHNSRRLGGLNPRIRSMNLSPNSRKIYFTNDTAPVVSFFEWDWQATNIPQEIKRLSELSAKLTPDAYTGTTGHDAWDNEGRFYFTSFGGEDVPPTPDVAMVRIDPVRLKASLGILPGIPLVSLQTERGIGLRRQGDFSTTLSVLLESKDGSLRQTIAFPAGTIEVPIPDVPSGITWQVIPDGDTYLKVLTCKPGDRDYCHWMGVCHAEGSACVCDDAEHRSPEDQCLTWRQVIVPPGMTCKPGDRSYCHWMGVCNTNGNACVCDDAEHRSPEDQCLAWHPVLVPPGMTCKPGDRSYCHHMGNCNSQGTECICDDAIHRFAGDRCARYNEFLNDDF